MKHSRRHRSAVRGCRMAVPSGRGQAGTLRRRHALTGFLGVGVLVGSALGLAFVSQLAPGIEEAPTAAIAAPPTSVSPSSWAAPITASAGIGRGAFMGSMSGRPGRIPPSAQLAYERAAEAITDVDAECGLDWPLLAGVGWVETQHGSGGGSSLDESGAMRVALYGPALTTTDSDSGRFDDRDDVDRPVGPMQFLPHVWAEAGVDANGDGQRNPQDINDAALGVAVYLCSGAGNLGDELAATDMLQRFNSVDGYAPAVLRASSFYRRHTSRSAAPSTSGPVETVLVGDSPTASASASPSVHLTLTPSPHSSSTRPPTPVKTSTVTATVTVTATPKATQSTSPKPSATGTTTAKPTASTSSTKSASTSP